MSGKLQAIRGMHDILPPQANQWRNIEHRIISVITGYGYEEIRLPIVEKTELFARSIGEFTDIVSKEMYTFTDRNEESLTLRPEGTAGCVRSGLEHGLFYNQIQKLWYIGPMFRHERPQKGRQRQFHQIGIEAFGLEGPDIDAEMIMLCTRIWKGLNLNDVTLELNSLGTPSSRQKYRNILVEYLSDNKDQLDEDSLRRLETNPLRILDSKNPDMQSIIQNAPDILSHLDSESAEHFAQVRKMLDGADITYKLNPHLVRGLDYYGKTVFEWTTNLLGAQGTLCAGGRFDGLVEHFGGKPTPAIGCAMGLERLIELTLQQTGAGMSVQAPHAYMILGDEDAIVAGLKLAESLRDQLPGLRLITHSGGGSIKSQFKKADKSGALLAIILGNDELSDQTASIKSLRDDSQQISVPWAKLAPSLREALAEQLNLG